MNSQSTNREEPSLETLVDLPSLFSGWTRLWEPKQRLSLSEWAEKNFVLSPEYSAGSGDLRLYGWQRGILDSFTDPRVSEVWVMSGTQLIKTLFIQCAIAYTIAEDPGPILVLQPKEADAKSFSKERIGPMCRDIPALQGKVSRAKSRNADNTILEKSFPGGLLAVAGAVSPGNAARRSVMVFIADEIDKYPASAGHEGDILALGDERTATYQTRAKKIRCCSPTVAGRSRIAKGYASSDQRKPWAPCPHCGERQILTFDQVKWEEGDPHSAYYQCRFCGAPWNDAQRWNACERVEWRADAPFRGVAGFWISHLYSPWKTLKDIVAKYLEAKDDPEQYKAFLNTNLAELYEESGETPDEDVLMGRRENYPFGPEAVVPERGLFLSCAVDVQESPPRLEYEVTAWGRDRENWSIEYGSIQVLAPNGQPLPVTSPELWSGLQPGQSGSCLDDLLNREWRHASGNMMPIMLMGIDTGKRPQPVYAFVRKHAQPVYGAHGISIAAPRTVVPLKGNADPFKVISGVTKEDAARKRQHVRIVTLGTHRIKQEIADALRETAPREDGGPVIGCYHFPQYSKEYFEGLCSEQRIVKPESGKVVWKRKPNTRNEPWDLKVYGRGLYSIFGADRFTENAWRRFELALTPASSAAGGRPATAAPQRRPKIIPSRYLS